MSNELSYELAEALEKLAEFSALKAVNTLLAITFYVLGSLALYTMAKRRGIHNAWLSWIPVGNVWILGSLSDQYRYVSRREVNHKRKVLLTLYLILSVVGIMSVILLIWFFVSIFGLVSGYSSEDQIVNMLLGPFMGFAIMALPVVGMSIAACIIQYMALYDVFQSCTSQKAVLFLVLSIVSMVIGLIIPGFAIRNMGAVFLFVDRKKDEGMVRQQPQQPYTPPFYVNEDANTANYRDASQNSFQGGEGYREPQESRQNPAGSAEPWTQKPEDQDPWNHGPEQL